jgi:hypothetical protein
VTRRAPFFALVTAAPVALAWLLNVLSACTPTDCVSRGSSTSFSGSATYTGQTSTSRQLSLTGATSASLVVYDADSSCSYDDMEFMITLGTCSLWLILDDSGDDGGTSTTASVESGQSCALDLASGAASMTVATGTLVIDTSAQLTLAGDIVVPVDGASASGYLQWSFLGE